MEIKLALNMISEFLDEIKELKDDGCDDGDGYYDTWQSSEYESQWKDAKKSLDWLYKELVTGGKEL